MPEALVIALAVATYGLLHSLLASASVKRWFRTRLGPSVDRFYRLAYNLFALVSFVPVLALLVWRPGAVVYRLGPPWIAIAVTGQLLSAALLGIGLLQANAWSFLGLQPLMGTSQAPSRLVTTGLYRWVRHPLYTAGLLLIWLTPLMTSGLLAFNLVLTAYVVAGSRLEERRLVAEFGADYHAYQRQVPSLFPLRWRTRR
jgi:protein-S-isoprenylcysteine O-methyltransferase Ste14